jgi:hypothetical protein
MNSLRLLDTNTHLGTQQITLIVSIITPSDDTTLSSNLGCPKRSSLMLVLPSLAAVTVHAAVITVGLMSHPA